MTSFWAGRAIELSASHADALGQALQEIGKRRQAAAERGRKVTQEVLGVTAVGTLVSVDSSESVADAGDKDVLVRIITLSELALGARLPEVTVPAGDFTRVFFGRDGRNYLTTDNDETLFWFRPDGQGGAAGPTEATFGPEDERVPVVPLSAASVGRAA